MSSRSKYTKIESHHAEKTNRDMMKTYKPRAKASGFQVSSASRKSISMIYPPPNGGGFNRGLPQIKTAKFAANDEATVKKAGNAGATAGGLGTSFAVCHSVCQSLVAVLAIMGITLLGMPLAFLEPYSIPLLIVAAASLGFSVWLCIKHSLPLRTLLKPLGIGFLAAAIIVFSIFYINAFTMIGTPGGNPDQTGDNVGELPDKCKTPPGYTDEDWKQHMNHHPDQYAECLAG